MDKELLSYLMFAAGSFAGGMGSTASSHTDNKSWRSELPKIKKRRLRNKLAKKSKQKNRHR